MHKPITRVSRTRRRSRSGSETFTSTMESLPSNHETPVTKIVEIAWTALTKEEQELILPRLLNGMPGWYKRYDNSWISSWLEMLFEDAGIKF